MRPRWIALLFVLPMGACTVYTTDGPNVDPDADKQYICVEGTKTLRVDDDEVREYLNRGARLGRCQ